MSLIPAEDADDIEEENGSDGGEGDKSNEGKSISKSVRKHLNRKARKAQLRKDLERLSTGDQPDTTHKIKRPKWTRHQKWKLTKFRQEYEIKGKKKEMGLTIKKDFETINILLDETQHALWNQVLVKMCHTAGWEHEKGE